MVARKPKPMPPFVTRVLGLLLPLGPVHAKAMFGGYGLCLDGTMFAIVTRAEELYFKVDDDSRSAFLKAGGEPFTYERTSRAGESRIVVMSYCTPPDGALAGAKRLLPWAERGLAAAQRAARGKPAKRRRA